MAHLGWQQGFGYPYAPQQPPPPLPSEAAPPLPLDAPPLPSDMPPPLPVEAYPEPQPPLGYMQLQPPTSMYPPPAMHPPQPMQQPHPPRYPMIDPAQQHLMQQRAMVANPPPYMPQAMPPQPQAMPPQMHPYNPNNAIAAQQYMHQQHQHHQHHQQQQQLMHQSMPHMGMAPNPMHQHMGLQSQTPQMGMGMGMGTQLQQQQQQQQQMHAMWRTSQQQFSSPQPPLPSQMPQRPMQPQGFAGGGGPAALGMAPMRPPTVVGMQQSKPLIDTCATTKDARDVFRAPGRNSRPAKIAVLLRGLPGSGKTRVARALRDAEVDAGAEPPKVHCLDDYFMTEVEKEVVEEEPSASGKPVKRRRKLLTTEYEYEAELEPAYKASLLKGLTRTAKEGRFPVVIVDCCNVKAKELTEQHSILKAENYEVYVLQPSTKDMDPQLCAGRNVHGRSLEEVQAMAKEWEPTPVVYTRLDAGPMCDGDAGHAGITEVDMDAGDGEDVVVGSVASGSRGAAGDAAEALPHGLSGSRWTSAEDEEEDTAAAAAEAEAARQRKRQRREKEASAGAVEESRAAMPSAMGGKKGRRVRWVDEESEKEAAKGFTVGVGGKHLRPFEEVHVIAGMGPANDEGEMARAVVIAAEGRFGLVKRAPR